MTEAIKVGFVGAKRRGKSLFDSLVMNEATGDLVEPVAMYDIVKKHLKPWKFLVEHTTAKLGEFEKIDMDAVVIASPADTHVELAQNFLRLGIDVWCEVPMALSMEGIYKILDASRESPGCGNFAYLENYCWMLQPQFCAMHHRAGDFGDIYYCEGEYSHSVEKLLMEENMNHCKQFDPDVDYGKGMGDPIPGKPGMREWIPTWRGKKIFYPIQYPHAFGPLHYVLNAKRRDRPVEVQLVGNKIMPPHRLKLQTFNLALITMDSGAICHVIRGSILKKHRIAYSFRGSSAIFEGASNQLDHRAEDMRDRHELQQRHHWYFVPEEERRFPQRHKQKSQMLTDQDLIAAGVKTAPGGHYGSDSLMFESIVRSTLENRPAEINAVKAAEQMAPLILAVQAMKEKKTADIPKFD